MTKFSVVFINMWNREDNIHLFAKSKEEALASVWSDGVGFAGGKRVFPKKVINVVDMDVLAFDDPLDGIKAGDLL
jgi:hypothetical protein